MHSATAESFPFYEKCKKKIALTEKLGFRSIFFQNGRISAPPKISTDDYSTNTEAKEVVWARWNCSESKIVIRYWKNKI